MKNRDFDNKEGQNLRGYEKGEREKIEGVLDRKRKEKKVFNFLDNLQKSGKTNMLGATPYLIEEFGMSRQKAKQYLIKWMKDRK